MLAGLSTACKHKQAAVEVISISLDKTSLQLEKGGTEKLTATVEPANASNKNISWSSDNENTATVDADGNVKAAAEGEATITVTTQNGGKTATCSVKVIEKGKAILTVDPAHKTIKVKVTSSDGSRITVEGADKDGINSDTETELTAKDTQIILKNSKITKLICLNNKLTAIDVRGLSDLQELKCYSNKLTSLDVQGLAQLQKLYCSMNQLNAEAFTTILNALPQRQQSDNAKCVLFFDDINYAVEDGNYGFSAPVPPDLQAAFKNAKTVKHWALKMASIDSQDEQYYSEGYITLPVPEASLTLGSEDEIKIKAETSDGKDITVIGCTETNFASNWGGTAAVLHVKPGVSKIVLKGEITKLDCSGNKLTAIDVRGLSDLQELNCSLNNLNAEAFTTILNALPQRQQSDNAKCVLFKDDAAEENYKFPSPVPRNLKTAFENARDTKKWKIEKSGGTAIILPQSQYVEVDYTGLETYLANTASSTEINYIEVTGDIPIEDFEGNLINSHPEAGELGKRILAAAPKKVALKLPGKVTGLNSMFLCFADCTNLVSVADIPSSVKSMSSCFVGCTSLTQAPDIPSSVTDMTGCFYGCTSLTQAPDIPSDVTDMSGCFSGCSALKRVKLNCNYDGTGYIFNEVFLNCTALENGGIQVKTAQYDAYTAEAALTKMAVPGATVEEKRAKFSRF